MDQAEKDKLIANINSSIEFYAKRFSESRNAAILRNTLLDYLDNNVYSKIGSDRIESTEDVDAYNSSLILSFCCIINLEMLIIHKHLLLSDHKWEEIYFLRRLCLVIQETFKENSNFGKMLNEYKNKGVASTDFEIISKMRKSIFKNIGEERLSDLRNTNAHLEFNILAYYDKVLEINNIEDINKVFSDFDKYITSLINIAGEIGRYIDKKKKDENEELLKNLEYFSFFNDSLKDTVLRNEVMTKIKNDYSENESLHIEAKILFAYSAMKAGLQPNEAYEKAQITKEFYDKYKPHKF